MLYLNNAQEVGKLQKLQNRCLRMCFDINNPRDMSVARLHDSARLNLLETRQETHLLNIMFMLKCNNKFRKQGLRVTRNADRYVFNTEIVHMDVYAKSPYYRGVALWNNLPLDIQNICTATVFKNAVKEHLGVL